MYQPNKCDCFNGFCWRQFCIDKADKWAKKDELEDVEKAPRTRGKRRKKLTDKTQSSES